MPCCNGRPDKPCPFGRNDSSVRSSQGDLMLGLDCDRFRFPPNYASTRSVKSTKPVKQKVVGKSEKQIVINELLACIWYYRDCCSRSALLKVISGFFSAAQISNAKKCLLSEFDSHLNMHSFFVQYNSAETFCPLQGVKSTTRMYCRWWSMTGSGSQICAKEN